MVRKKIPAAWSVGGRVQLVPCGGQDPTNQPGDGSGVRFSQQNRQPPAICRGPCHERGMLVAKPHNNQQQRGMAHVVHRSGWEFLRAACRTAACTGGPAAQAEKHPFPKCCGEVWCACSQHPSAVACCGVNSHSMPAMPCYGSHVLVRGQASRAHMCTIGRAAAVVDSGCARLICAAWWHMGVCCRKG